MFGRAGLVALAGIATALISACGSGSAVDDETAIRETIAQFDTAVAARDWDRTCTLFSELGIEKIELDHESCAARFEERYPESAPPKEPTEITKIGIAGHHATVIAAGVGVLTLSYEDDRWKLD